MSVPVVDLLRPELAWTLLAGPLVLALGLRALARRRRARAALVDARRAERALDASDRAVAARVALAGAAALLLGASLLGPVRGWVWREVRGTGIDLVVALDTSRSMLATDVRPTRLDRAKREVRGLLDALSGDRVALVAFSGDAREVAPLTHDRSALAALLERVTPGENRVGGTDLAAAIERALALFDGRTGSTEAVVLVTDGEDLAGEGLAAAREAAERGIRVHVVGVGTEGGSKIPVVAADGSARFLVGPEGDEVVTRMDGASLARLAEATGGTYLSVADHPTPLEVLYERRIAPIEGRELTGGKERVPRDRYQWTLALALGCMAAESALRERRRGGRRP